VDRFPVDPILLKQYRASVDLTNFPKGFLQWFDGASETEKDRWFRERFLCLKYHMYLQGFAEEIKEGAPDLPPTYVPIMGMDFQPEPHDLLFAQYLQKRPGEGIVLSDLDTVTKKRMVLYSRGTFKTSSTIVEIVQCILNYPDIRICFLTGGHPLAKRQLARVKRVFERPTKRFKFLFPEFCLVSRPIKKRKKIKTEDGLKVEEIQYEDVTPKFGTTSEFTVPCRINDMLAEPTFAISTAKSVKAGSHFDMIFIDDLVNDQNYRSVKALENCYNDYLDICPLLEPSGFMVVTGTRYSFGDTYERLQEMARQEEKERGRTIWKFSIRGCWTTGCQNCVHNDAYHEYSLNIVEPPCTHPGCPCPGFKARGNKGVLFPLTRTHDGREIGHTVEWLDAERLRVGSEFFACFPAGSKVLRDDWSETSIEDLCVEDRIIGFDRGLLPASVEYVHIEKSIVIKATTDTGREIFCTPDHKFLRLPNGGERKYGVLQIGTQIVPVYTPTVLPERDEQRDLDWLGGILDGEGSVAKGRVSIAQSHEKNPAIYKRIEETLNRVGISFRYGRNNSCVDIFDMRGGRSLKIRLLRDCRMAKTDRFRYALWDSSKQIAETAGRRGGSSYERIVKIEEMGVQTVYNIQSSSGNFICQGVAVKNCQYENQPIATGTQTFTETLLDRQTLFHEQQMPTYHQSTTFVIGDLAYVGQEGRDYSVIFVCRVFQGQIFVIDCAFGNWDSNTVAVETFKIMMKHRPVKIYYEKFNGWEAYNNVITAYCKERGLDQSLLEWIKGSQAQNAKLIRIGAVKGPLQQRRLWFFAGMPGYSILRNQLLKWPKLGKHDDFADTCGMVVAAPTNYQMETPPQVVNGLHWLAKLHQTSPFTDEYGDSGAGTGINCG
jgi:hypothetical protein